MRLSVRISPVEPGLCELPEQSPYSDYEGKRFTLHQEHCAKALRDPAYEDVEAQRHPCLCCDRAFRVYPNGVSRGQQSDALTALQLLLSQALGLGKTTFYRNDEGTDTQHKPPREDQTEASHATRKEGQ